MSKYYNKEIPTEIHVVYGGRQSGKSYYEVKKLEEKCEFLKKENFEWYKRYERLVNRIGKAIELLKEDYFEDGSGNNVEEVIKILKGEE